MTTDDTGPEKELAAAMSAALAELGPVHRNKRNPHYRSTYADLAAVVEAIRGPATRNGIAWSHTTNINSEGWIVVITTIIHAGGGYRTHAFPAKPSKTDPQSIAGVISYGMRYGLLQAFGLPTSDDRDGEPRRRPSSASGARAVGGLGLAEAAAKLDALGLAVEAVDKWREAQGRPTLRDLDDRQRATLIEFLGSSDHIRDQIKNADG